MDEGNSKSTITIKGGGFFSRGNSFGGVIKKTKSSESSLIKNYESMEKATKNYNKSFKEHLANLNKLDDYANFSGMKNLFQKVIMKEVITSGAKVDTSMPLLFRNYHIEKEPTPSAFRREHILNQVRYILETSFAGREHMLIKYMSVEIGKSQFILHITTIENIKKSWKLDHNGYVIDAGGTRAALKNILSTTKKNLKRRTALVEIGRGSSSAGSSKRKRTKKNYSSSSISSLLRSKKSSGKSNKSRSHSGIANEDDSSMDNLDIGSSKESIKSLARTKKEPSNKLSSMIDLKSMKLSSKQSKPSIYKRPSEKRPVAAAVVAAPFQQQSPASIPLAPGAMPPAPLTGDFAGKKLDILGGPAPSTAFTPLPGQPAQSPYQQAAPQQQRFKPCRENTDATSCQADPTCFWDANYQSCKFNRPRNGRVPGAGPTPNPFGAAPTPNPFGAAPGAAQPGIVFPAPAAAPLSPPPMIEAI
jgi:hypothetical protein